MADADIAFGSTFELRGVKYARLKMKKFGELTGVRRAEKREILAAAMAASPLPAEERSRLLVKETTGMIDLDEMKTWLATERGFRAALQMSLQATGKTEAEADEIIESLRPDDAASLAWYACGFLDLTVPKEASENPPQAAQQ